MTATDNSQAIDLRATYLLAFDSFATDPSEVADALGANTRYARELLGTLVSANLLAESEDGDGQPTWQVSNPGTYDDNTRDDAIKVIDEWLNRKYNFKSTTKKGSTVNATTTSKPRAKKTTNPTGKCLCGCGANSTSNYRPGHDARHAGQVARTIAGDKVTPAQATKELDALPSEALRLKASAMADRLREKALSKDTKIAVIKERAKAANETADSTAKPKPPAKTATRTRKSAAKKA